MDETLTASTGWLGRPLSDLPHDAAPRKTDARNIPALPGSVGIFCSMVYGDDPGAAGGPAEEPPEQKPWT
jgi:hypothetical protein